MNPTETITVQQFPITLAQFLKWAGVAMNGGEAKGIIREGLVSVNGQICVVAGQKLKPGDVVGIEQQHFVLEQA